MRIGVVGSINMDQVILSSCIPKKGETVIGKSVEYKDGGKGSNQAVAIARLGATTVMFGKVGDDENGKILLSHMKDNGVDVSNVCVEKNVPTGLALITVGENDNTIVVVSGANACVDKKYIDEKLSEIKKCDIIVMQHEIPQETNEYLIDFCKKNGIKTLLNPAPAKELSNDIIEKVDYITPNEHEAELIFKVDFKTALKKYPEKLIITLGSEGVTTCIKDKGIVNIPCRANTKVVDTTGAGDTFNGAFVYAITSNQKIEDALRFGNIAAGLSTEKIGAQAGMPFLNEVMKEI